MFPSSCPAQFGSHFSTSRTKVYTQLPTPSISQLCGVPRRCRSSHGCWFAGKLRSGRVGGSRGPWGHQSLLRREAGSVPNTERLETEGSWRRPLLLGFAWSALMGGSAGSALMRLSSEVWRNDLGVSVGAAKTQMRFVFLFLYALLYRSRCLNLTHSRKSPVLSCVP